MTDSIEDIQPQIPQRQFFVRIPEEVIRSRILSPVDKLLFSNLIKRFKYFTQTKTIPTLYTPRDETLSNEIGEPIDDVLVSLSRLSQMNLINIFQDPNGIRIIEVNYFV